MQKCIEIAKSNEVSNTQLKKNMDQTTQEPEDVHKVKMERLTDIGVLVPVDEPTDWVSNLVIATKESGDLSLA